MQAHDVFYTCRSGMIVHDVQQNSDAWTVLRCGVPTASEFHSIITSKGELSKQLGGYAAQLAAEKFAGRPLERWEGNQWTTRGHALEDTARTVYSLIHDVDLELVGFVTNYGAGASPDAFVAGGGLAEIKVLAPKNHVLTLDYFARHRRCPPDYVAQAMGQMLICEREWCDLYFYSDALPCLTVRVHRDDKFLSMLRAAIDAVNAERDRFMEILRTAA